MNRLDRRLTLLRGKRQGAFDPDQYWMERADRARVARRVRTAVRHMRPVVLLTPRWSSPRRFLDDVATDLLIGTPAVSSRTLDCSALKGRTNHQAWAWFVEALVELSGVVMEGPAWQAVSRLGFQRVVGQCLDAIQRGDTRRCLMLHGLQHVPFEALEDLILAYETWLEEVDDPRFTLVAAGSVAPDEVQVGGAGRPVYLDDFTPEEAVEALVEDLGPLPRHQLESAVEVVGGVPQILEELAAQGERALTELVARPETLWSRLGALAGEIRGAFEILASNDAMHARVERLTADGPQPEDVAVDPILVLAGFARRQRTPTGTRVRVRAPLFGELIHT